MHVLSNRSKISHHKEELGIDHWRANVPNNNPYMFYIHFLKKK